jgi:hypothetical protein
MIFAPWANFHIIRHGPQLKGDIFFNFASSPMPWLGALIAVLIAAHTATQLIIVRRGDIVSGAVRLGTPLDVQVFLCALHLEEVLVFGADRVRHEAEQVRVWDLQRAGRTEQVPHVGFDHFQLDVGAETVRAEGVHAGTQRVQQLLLLADWTLGLEHGWLVFRLG